MRYALALCRNGTQHRHAQDKENATPKLVAGAVPLAARASPTSVTAKASANAAAEVVVVQPTKMTAHLEEQAAKYKQEVLVLATCNCHVRLPRPLTALAPGQVLTLQKENDTLKEKCAKQSASLEGWKQRSEAEKKQIVEEKEKFEVKAKSLRQQVKYMEMENHASAQQVALLEKQLEEQKQQSHSAEDIEAKVSRARLASALSAPITSVRAGCGCSGGGGEAVCRALTATSHGA